MQNFMHHLTNVCVSFIFPFSHTDKWLPNFNDLDPQLVYTLQKATALPCLHLLTFREKIAPCSDNESL